MEKRSKEEGFAEAPARANLGMKNEKT